MQNILHTIINMGKFICNECDKSFTRRTNLDYHTNNNICRVKNYECMYCESQYTTKTSMYRHMRQNCKIKKREDIKRDEIYERLLKLEEDNKKIHKLEKENKKLKMEVDMIKKKGCQKNINNGIINNGNVNINNGTVNNITLVAYGEEDISKLDKNDILKVLRNGYNSTLKLTETVHFNPKYPEYHNIYITNMKDKYAMLYDGTNWTLTMKEDLINKIYDDKKNYIEDNLEDFLESLTISQKKALDRWVNTKEDDKKIRDIKEKIKLLLYNSKHIPLNTIEMHNDDNIKIIVKGKKKTKKVIKNIID